MKMYRWTLRKIRKWFFTGVLSVKERFFLLMFIVLFLLLAWGGFLSIEKSVFSLSGIIHLHTWWLVWFVDFLIISVPFAVIFVRNYINKKTAQYRSEIFDLNKRIQHNIELASNLKEGKDELGSKIPDDQLASVLLDIGKNIKVARQHEDEENYISKGKEQMSDLLRVHHDLTELTPAVLKALIEYLGAIQGAFYLLEDDLLKRSAMYAYNRRRFE
ncbi:MAG: hypothetical protein PWR04_1308, partial [Anaerophaga sp.]|nr:hypothetical protein [Anaerophaga sp.]